MNNSYRTSLCISLNEVFDAIKKTNTVSEILDEEWYRTIQDEIENYNFKNDDPFSSEKAIMFFQLEHHYKKLLPIWDERLTALRGLPFREKIETKFNHLKKRRYDLKIREILFELLALGFFAQKGVLTDIEPNDTRVDGVIEIDKRQILIEATHTSEEILPKRPGVGCGNLDRLIYQVEYKISQKVAEGRQIALADKVPAILVLGRNFFGADHYTSRIAIEECFNDPKFSKLSGIIVADSWKLIKTKFYPAKNPETPLSEAELETLNKWFRNKSST